MIGRVFRAWIEWEAMSGHDYMSQHDDQNVLGINVRLSIIYEIVPARPGVGP